MAISTYDVRDEYIGNGLLTAYTFDFKIATLTHLLVRVTNASYVKTFEVRGNDTTYLTSVTFDAINGGGTVHLASALPSGHKLTILLANDAPLQASEFKNKRDFTLARFEDALDVLGGAVQRLAYLTKRSLRIGDSMVDSDMSTFDPRIPLNQTGATDGGKILAVSDDGLGLQLGPTTTQIFTASGNAIAAAAQAGVYAADALNSKTLALAAKNSVDATKSQIDLDIIEIEADRVEVAQNAAFASSDATTASDAAISAQSSQDACFAYRLEAQADAAIAAAAAASASISESNANSDASAAVGAAASASADAAATALDAITCTNAKNDALASKNAAAQSEINAAASEGTAQGYATNAQGYSNSALNYKNDAAASAAAALISEGNAAVSDGAAFTSANNALNSAGNAAVSETNAATSAANAALSEAAAAQSAADALINSTTGVYDHINLTTILNNPAYQEGRVFYDKTEKTLSYYNDVNGVTVNLGQETFVRVRNTTGSTIANGKVVYVISAGTSLPQIALALADSAATSEGVIGVVTNDIANGANGYVTVLGLVHDLNTNAWTEGDVLYVSVATPGNLTNVRPTGLDFIVRVAVVTKKDPTTGHILVFPTQLGQAVRQLADGGTGATTAYDARVALGAQTVFSGLEDYTKFAISYNSTTRIFSITYTAGAAAWVQGTRYAKSGTVNTTAHAATTGMWYCYFDNTGTLVTSQTFWDLTATAPVMSAYYNATTPAMSIVYDERHPAGTGMSDATHKYLHLTQGTKLLSGCVVSGYSLNTNGSTGWASSAGSIADEDYTTTVAATLIGDAKRIFYKIGAQASPRWDYVADADGILDNGTDLYYNQNNAGTWQQTAITVNNRWVNYWIVATPTLTGPQMIVIMGQALYTTLGDAQAATVASGLTDLNLLTAEGVVLYKMTYRRGGFGAPGNANLVAVQTINSPVLSGTSIGAITAASVSTDTTNFTGVLTAAETNVQKALDKLSAITAFPYQLKAVTTTYVQEAVYNWFNCSATADYSITLLTAVGKAGQEFVWRKTTDEGAIITLVPAGTETIDGLPFATLQQQWDQVKLVSDNVNWMIKR